MDAVLMEIPDSQQTLTRPEAPKSDLRNVVVTQRNLNAIALHFNRTRFLWVSDSGKPSRLGKVQSDNSQITSSRLRATGVEKLAA
jgi:hypothetical protein